ncbi:MAG: hypothetical protein HKL96_11570 [Phycisphaerales bacterium]|nr:hypothetical protein [Phycisphaerales bacterium]
MRYVARVLFSDSKLVIVGRRVVLLGDQWLPPGGVFGGAGRAVMLGRSDPVVLQGTVFVDTVFSTHAKGVFRLWGGQRVLPIGLAIPSPVGSGQVKSVGEGLRVWAQARASGFHFYPRANLLPIAQDKQLMKSRNFYVWALGVASYCAAGAPGHGLIGLGDRTYFRTKRVQIRLANGRPYTYTTREPPALARRRSFWLLYAATQYSGPPGAALKGWRVTDYLEASVLGGAATGGFLPMPPTPGSGACVTPPVAPGWLRIRLGASVARFLAHQSAEAPPAKRVGQ